METFIDECSKTCPTDGDRFVWGAYLLPKIEALAWEVDLKQTQLKGDTIIFDAKNRKIQTEKGGIKFHVKARNTLSDPANTAKTEK